MAASTEPALLREPSIRFDGDVPVDAVPERYRLGDAFVPKGRYLDVEFLRARARTALPADVADGVSAGGAPRCGQLRRVPDRRPLGADRPRVDGFDPRLPQRLPPPRHAPGHRSRPRRVRSSARSTGGAGTSTARSSSQLDPEEFTPRSDDDLGLQTVRCELWGGFVFINMDPDAPPLLEYLDPIPSIFAPFQFEHMRYKWFKGTIVPCNWKTVLDGFLEAYHVPGTHPQLNRSDKTNDNLVTHAGARRAARAWSPTTVFERHAKYQSARREAQADRPRAPREGSAERPGVRRRRIRARGSPAPWSTSTASCVRSRPSAASAPPSCCGRPRSRRAQTAGQYHLELYRQLAIEDGFDWPEITPAAVGGGRHGVARVPQHDPAPQPGIGDRLPGTAERARSGQRAVRDVLPRADPRRRLRQEVGRRARVLPRLPSMPTSARSSRRTSPTPRTSRSGCTRRASTATG